MSWGKSYGYNNSYGYNSCGCNSYDSNYRNDSCDCDSFFKNISRGEQVEVVLKGGDVVKGSFVDVKGDTVELANAECRHHHKHDHKHDKHDCEKKNKVRIITICCDQIVAVEV